MRTSGCAEPVLGSRAVSACGQTPNFRLQRPALRAAADAERWADLEGPEAQLAEMDMTAENVVELMDQISELDVSDEFTTYAGMQKHLWQLRIEKSGALRDGFALLRRYAAASEEDERRELLQAYETNMAEVVIPLNGQIVRERDAAQRYFEENHLGG